MGASVRWLGQSSSRPNSRSLPGSCGKAADLLSDPSEHHDAERVANQLTEFRHAELVAEAAHQRQVRQAKQARADHGGRPRVQRTWRRLLVLGRA